MVPGISGEGWPRPRSRLSQASNVPTGVARHRPFGRRSMFVTVLLRPSGWPAAVLNRSPVLSASSASRTAAVADSLWRKTKTSWWRIPGAFQPW